MKGRVLVLTLALAAAQSCQTLPVTTSARRYINVPYSFTLTDSKLLLLDRREAQRELGLARKQIKSISELANISPRNVPGFEKWREQHVNAGQSPREAKGLASQVLAERLAAFDALNELVASHQESGLGKILTTAQQERLRGLVLQMEGPSMVVRDAALAAELGLTNEQLSRIRALLAEYDKLLEPFQERYRHTMLQKNRESQTMAELEAEQDALVVVLAEIFKARDEAILEQLSDSQRDALRDLEGRPLPIRWPRHWFFYVPFSEE
jgi:hypothetical protein